MDSDNSRHLREAIHQAELRLDGIIEAAMDAIITIDEQERVVLYNRAAAKMFGTPVAGALGAPIERFIPQRFRANHHTHIRRFGETGTTTRRMGGRTVLYALRADGSEFPIDASISQVEIDGRRLYTVILRDVTERVRAEHEIERHHRELADLSRAANNALEDERRRVARELHDELGQMLTAIKMDIAETQAQLPSDRLDLEQRCTQISTLLDQTIASVRRISADLRPLVLDDLGLGAAIEWLASNITQRSGLAISVSLDPSLDQVPEPQASAIFRIVQESLTNVVRHAQARGAAVSVEFRDASVLVAVRDDGRGITADDLAKPASLGLRGLRERARLLGGDARAGNADAGGTLIEARIPLAASTSGGVPS